MIKTNKRHILSLFILILIVIATSFTGILLTHYGPAVFDPALLLIFRNSDDLSVMKGPEWIHHFWLSLTWLGDTLPRIIIASLTIAALLLIRRWRSVLFMLGVLLSGVVLSTFLKHWVGRPRPQLVPHLDHVGSQSFPSNHTLNSTLFYFTVAIVLSPLLSSYHARRMLYLAAFILSIASGLSRIALGVHWPSDVIASWLIASAWLSFWYLLTKYYWPKLGF